MVGSSSWPQDLLLELSSIILKYYDAAPFGEIVLEKSLIWFQKIIIQIPGNFLCLPCIYRHLNGLPEMSTRFLFL